VFLPREDVVNLISREIDRPFQKILSREELRFVSSGESIGV
jgi:hypothetical protein